MCVLCDDKYDGVDDDYWVWNRFSLFEDKSFGQEYFFKNC